VRAFVLLLALAPGIVACGGPPPAEAPAEPKPVRRPDVGYVPTRPEIVDAMLEVAGVGDGDVVYDLGCGDGRIVIAAALRGARGVGVDIDPRRVQEATANAQASGVADRVTIVEQDLFLTDLRDATVVTLYLLPELNRKLRPKLWKELKPGSRVVSNRFSMGEWQPDRVIKAGGTSTVYLWTIPDDAAERIAAEEAAAAEGAADAAGAAPGASSPEPPAR
jgi:precorrin-6B methylase 2